jgi:phospholipid/cholesterol/gamma-HCH transport system ATP-binding protein
LKDINLNVPRGETLSVLGRSGTGKSVLLKLIIGLQKPDSGSILVNDEDITKLPPKELNEVRKRVGFLFQQAALYDSLTIHENVAFPLRRHTDLSDKDRDKRVDELLASVDMDKDQQKLPAEISGGMQKRVGMARALALEPEILLFDEPTSGLDPISAAEIAGLILKLQQERHITSVVVTHDIQTARAVSNRLALMNDGQILVEGTYEEFHNSHDPFVAQFMKGC